MTVYFERKINADNYGEIVEKIREFIRNKRVLIVRTLPGFNKPYIYQNIQVSSPERAIRHIRTGNHVAITFNIFGVCTLTNSFVGYYSQMEVILTERTMTFTYHKNGHLSYFVIEIEE